MTLFFFFLRDRTCRTKQRELCRQDNTTSKVSNDHEDEPFFLFLFCRPKQGAIRRWLPRDLLSVWPYFRVLSVNVCLILHQLHRHCVESSAAGGAPALCCRNCRCRQINVVCKRREQVGENNWVLGLSCLVATGIGPGRTAKQF